MTHSPEHKAGTYLATPTKIGKLSDSQVSENYESEKRSENEPPLEIFEESKDSALELTLSPTKLAGQIVSAGLPRNLELNKSIVEGIGSHLNNSVILPSPRRIDNSMIVSPAPEETFRDNSIQQSPTNNRSNRMIRLADAPDSLPYFSFNR